MIKSAVSDEFGAPCTNNGENVILFLTDGKPTNGKATSA